jgi:hypothetical protein
MTDAELGTEVEFVLEGGGPKLGRELADEPLVLLVCARRT